MPFFLSLRVTAVVIMIPSFSRTARSLAHTSLWACAMFKDRDDHRHRRNRRQVAHVVSANAFNAFAPYRHLVWCACERNTNTKTGEEEITFYGFSGGPSYSLFMCYFV